INSLRRGISPLDAFVELDQLAFIFLGFEVAIIVVAAEIILFSPCLFNGNSPCSITLNKDAWSSKSIAPISSIIHIAFFARGIAPYLIILVSPWISTIASMVLTLEV